jgi:DNA-binding transcriptional ArsR family regulator
MERYKWIWKAGRPRLKVFADATRVRLLALLEGEELTVAELSAITQLAQPRVSTHLAKLKEAGLVRDRRAGVSAYYRFDDAALDPAQRALWQSISTGSDDPLLRQDAERVPAVLAMRAADQNWADSVAGDMERHYSPGRTWEALARTALPLLDAGRRARHRLRRRRAGRTAGAACASLRLRRRQRSAWSPPPASACAATPTWKCARATCMPCRSRTPASTWWC